MEQSKICSNINLTKINRKKGVQNASVVEKLETLNKTAEAIQRKKKDKRIDKRIMA